jgi:hypothetical protein
MEFVKESRRDFASVFERSSSPSCFTVSSENFLPNLGSFVNALHCIAFLVKPTWTVHRFIVLYSA